MEFVIDAYHQLWHIEKKLPDVQARHLQARPICHYLRESIEAHLSIAAAAMAVSPLHRVPNRLEYQEILPYHPPPLPHRENQSWQTRPRPQPTRGPTTSGPRSSRTVPTVRTKLSQVG